jgi:hypothetical protein
MTINIEPEVGVPLKDNDPAIDLTLKVQAASKTAKKLAKKGLKVKPTKEDEDVAAKLAVAYADDPEKTSKKATQNKLSTLTPASLVLTNNILTEFGQSVVKSATHVRHLVTNKLLLETENPDAKVRLRALELLGKISDVGLFAEKTEVTVTHQTSDELKQKLRQKLERLVNPQPTTLEAVESGVLDANMDLDAELGTLVDTDDEVYDDD